MMKYSNERVVEAKYTNPQGNPFAEALPPLLSKKEFDRQIRSKINLPKDCSEPCGCDAEKSYQTICFIRRSVPVFHKERELAGRGGKL